MKSQKYYMINALTYYRIIAAPVLIVLALMGYYNIFKWLLPVSFFTDLIDGFLARKFKATSVLGSRLDSIGDDLSFLAAVAGVLVFKIDFIKEHLLITGLLLGLFLIQIIIALLKYGRITSFHTYLAKVAALLQGSFLMLLFLLPQPVYILFYIASVITALDLIEEIIIAIYLPAWKADVKGLYWVVKKKAEQ